MEHRLADVARGLNLGQSLVDDRIMRCLGELPPDRAMKLLDDFEINLQQNKQGIRNPAAYLMGMATRVKKQVELPSTGAVQQELEGLFRAGHVAREEVDDRCLDMLGQLPEDKGLQAVAELRAADTSVVKNMSAFFMSVMKKYTLSTWGGAGGGPGGGGKGGGGPFGRGGAGGWEDEHADFSHHDFSRGGGGGGGGMDRDRAEPPRQAQGQHQGQGQGQHPAPELGFGLPAPRIMPAELLYGFGADEYTPEIPRVRLLCVHCVCAAVAGTLYMWLFFSCSFHVLCAASRRVQFTSFGARGARTVD